MAVPRDVGVRESIEIFLAAAEIANVSTTEGHFETIAGTFDSHE
jgi:hypothetical protein